MQKQGSGNRHIGTPINNTGDEGKLAASRGSPSTATVLRLFRSRTTEGPPLSTRKSKRPPITTIFLGSVEAARTEARQIINEPRAGGYTRIIEGWQQLPDGQIQFTIRALLDQDPLGTHTAE